VPGAMVSVVCSNALSKSLIEEGNHETGKLLDRTRELVIERFGRSEEEIKDGMDISLCALNTKTNNLMWSGANNPLWIIRNGESEIEEVKADKQPIGKYAKENPFTTHQIQLNEGDSAYIFSDGYPDQFGGEKGKKYKSGKMKRFLLSIVEKDAEQQRKMMLNEFESWRGDIEQIDDVCVIGFKI
jgi:serine phosphatase RsbU (regulator of sigma subunit)